MYASLRTVAALLALGASAAAADFSLAGYLLDVDAGPDQVTLQPGSLPVFGGALALCGSVTQLPGQTPAGSAELVLTDPAADDWLAGPAFVHLDFLDRVLVNDPGPDLVVFEMGGAEAFELSALHESVCEFSAPGKYTPQATGFTVDCGMGPVALNARAVDLSDLGVLPFAQVRRLRLDVLASGSGNGADVSLVWGLHTVPAGDAGAPCFLTLQPGLDDGAGEYLGLVDTCIASDFPATNFSTAPLEHSDAAPMRQLLLRFDGLVGEGEGQVPPGVEVGEALLQISTGPSPAGSLGTHAIRRILQPWDPASITWANAFGGNGVDGDNVEAESLPVATTPQMPSNATFQIDVTAAVQAWVDGAPNHGLVISANTSDALGLYLAEAPTVGLRPALSVAIRDGLVFAEELGGYSPTVVNDQPKDCHRNGQAAIGPPDYVLYTTCCSDLSFASLGPGGSIALTFTSASISGDGTPEPDLWIYEVGPDVEDTFVEVSDGVGSWIPVGTVTGSTSSVDLDAFGIGPESLYSQVRLTDDPNEGDTSGCSVGADIDAVAVLAPNAWVSLGGGLSGTGQPSLGASGDLSAGELVTFLLGGAPPDASAWLVLGTSVLGAPFKGGTLVPQPQVLLQGLPTGPAGTLQLAAPWPAGVPAGTPVVLQAWIPDAGAPKGFAASNAVKALAQ